MHACTPGACNTMPCEALGAAVACYENMHCPLVPGKCKRCTTLAASIHKSIANNLMCHRAKPLNMHHAAGSHHGLLVFVDYDAADPQLAVQSCALLCWSPEDVGVEHSVAQLPQHSQPDTRRKLPVLIRACPCLL